VLGTAQLGMDYGIANRSGRPAKEQAREIVSLAFDSGVVEFDTAQDYGDAESVLGGLLSELTIAPQARVITKPDPKLDLSFDSGKEAACERALVTSVEKSVERLGVPALHGLLLHREALLEHWDRGLGETLAGLVSSGLVERVGVSVYTPGAALMALECSGLTLLQLPGNIFDRRFEAAGVFDLAAERGVAVHVRSVFLQGLALMEPEALPAHMAHARPFVARAKELATSIGVSRPALAMAYVREAQPGANVLFGAETPEQVRQNVAAWNAAMPDDLVHMVREAFENVPEPVLNPTMWKQ
jgi:aryl-alcohol dehydrogenase-like predicted oxidoreductase